MAAHLAASPVAGPVPPKSATIRPSLDRPRRARPYLSMSWLDFSEWPRPIKLNAIPIVDGHFENNPGRTLHPRLAPRSHFEKIAVDGRA
jgi:hypothetical protein